MEKRIKPVIIMTRPIFDVFSISIHPNKTKGCCPNPFSDGKLCHIYGTVKVRDEYQSVFRLYSRKEDDPDIIKLGDNISLTGFPVIRSKVLTVSVYLYDMAHQAEISNDTFTLDYSCCEYPYDKLRVSEAKGQHGFAYVRHATFLHAVVAHVEEILITKEDGGSSSDLCGSVVAYLVGADDNEYASALLFDNNAAHKDEECSKCVVAAKLNTPIQLLRSFVALPVFCTLRIDIDFRDENDCRISRTITRHIDGGGLYEESAMDGNWKFRIELSWPFCDEQFPRERGLRDQVIAKQVFTQDLKAINFSLPSEPEGIVSRCTRQISKSLYTCYVDVHSVLICSDEDVVDIEGTITLYDSSGESCLHIFRGSDKLSSERRTLAIQSPPSLFKIKGDNFHIAMSLKDGKDRVVGKGNCKWCGVTMDHLYDRHLCAVYRGEIAYTVVHFSLLSRSIEARVVVSFINKETQVGETSQVCVCGSITAEYGSYEYSTPYDQQNFKYKLFSRSEDECTRLELGSTLELSKSLLPVPFEEALILDVDLKVGQQGVDQNFEDLKQVVEFEHCKSNIFALEIGNYTFVIWVDWGNRKDPKSFKYPNFPDMRSLRKVMPNIPLKVGSHISQQS